MEGTPRLSCDCHVHVFDVTQSHRLRPGRVYEPTDNATTADLLKMHRGLGIERGVIVQASAYGSDHEVMLQGLETAGENYRGVAIISDAVTDAMLARFDRAGVRGARFNFASFLNIVPTVEEFERGVARVRELGWHVKIFAVGDDILAHAAMFRRLGAPIVFDHMCFAQPDLGINQAAFRCLLDFVRDGAWVTISNFDRCSRAGAPWKDMEPFAQALIEASPDRVLWATDWPHLSYEGDMSNEAELLEFAGRCCPDAGTRRKLLAANSAALYFRE